MITMPINTLSSVWAVNGTPIYTPSINVKYEHTNLTGSSTGRDESGYNHIDWIRRDLRKVTVTYSAATGDEVRYLRDLVQGNEYDFTYEDLGQVQTFHAYTGDMSYTLYTKTRYPDEGGLYTDVTFDAVEI